MVDHVHCLKFKAHQHTVEDVSNGHGVNCGEGRGVLLSVEGTINGEMMEGDEVLRVVRGRRWYDCSRMRRRETRQVSQL